MDNKEIMNIKELSEYLRCSISTIRNLIKDNKIPFFRIGVKYHFKVSSIERWIHERENNN